jgi:hypothetical protein
LKTISKLKKELDKWFSLFIRLNNSNEFGMVQCFTCGRVKNYKSGIQNGHFQSRSFLATRFNEKNCQPQCVACNMFRAGEQFKFAMNLEAKYGEGTAEYLEGLARTTVKISRIDYEEKISYYKSCVDKFKKQKGIE